MVRIWLFVFSFGTHLLTFLAPLATAEFHGCGGWSRKLVRIHQPVYISQCVLWYQSLRQQWWASKTYLYRNLWNIGFRIQVNILWCCLRTLWYVVRFFDLESVQKLRTVQIKSKYGYFAYTAVFPPVPYRRNIRIRAYGMVCGTARYKYGRQMYDRPRIRYGQEP
jgi:hypothetical protein